jgi:hypothetical protein
VTLPALLSRVTVLSIRAGPQRRPPPLALSDLCHPRSFLRWLADRIVAWLNKGHEQVLTFACVIVEVNKALQGSASSHSTSMCVLHKRPRSDVT